MNEKLKDTLTQTPETPIDEEENGSDKNPEVEPTVDASIQHQFNELKREYLNERSNAINRLLVFICIVLVFFTIIIPVVTGIAAYFVYQKYDELQTHMLKHENAAKNKAAEAAEHANQAETYLKEIKADQTKLKGIVSQLTSKDFSNPNKVETLKTTIQDLLQNPALSLEDKVIIETYKLQRVGKIPEAIEKWRSIANTAMNVNDELVARAFFSIGYLHAEQNERDQALSAYDEAITLMPDFAGAFTARGLVKSALGNAEDAITDHDEALRLKPDFAEAYINRGAAKRALDRHEEAIADYNEAIRLDPDSAVAYTRRGVSKNALGQHQEAIDDHNEAIRLNSNFSEAYINRGTAKRSLGQLAEAKADFDKALELAKGQ